MPAGSSRRVVSASHPVRPNASSAVGSAMPAPLSLTRTSPRSIVTSTRVAPARRAFWNTSLSVSTVVALKKRLTRVMASSWTRARMVAGSSFSGIVSPGRTGGAFARGRGAAPAAAVFPAAGV
ncbi:MAG: hypothetical protein OXG72_15620 [Acidobacteria bacterium]|nr:hypothetical protein [Acidobacteriota bacterium]